MKKPSSIIADKSKKKTKLIICLDDLQIKEKKKTPFM